MKFTNVLKWLVIAGFFGFITFSAAGVMLLFWVIPMNFTLYLQPLQMKVEINNQAFMVGFSTLTPTPFQPAPSASITPTLTASPTLTATPTLTPTFTPLPTATLTPTATPTHVPPTWTPIPTNTPVPGPPTEARISNIVGHPQLYTLDCESRSAVDLAGYFGISINEKDFLDKLPHSADPETGFVGNVWDPMGQLPPLSYGVYPGPIAALLKSYGLQASEQRNMSFEILKSEIASGRPVMTWVTGNTDPGWGVKYTAPDNRQVVVAAFEHTVIVIGYNPNYVTILDENMIYQRTVNAFLKSWAVLGNMAITISP